MEKEDKDLAHFLVGYTQALTHGLSQSGKEVSLNQFDKASRESIFNDCFSFAGISGFVIDKAITKYEDYSWKQAGWDFWETRNSTGFGFEDKVDFEDSKIWKNLFSRATNKPVEIKEENGVFEYVSSEYSFQNPEVIRAIQEKRALDALIPKTYEGVKEMVEKEINVNRPKMKM